VQHRELIATAFRAGGLVLGIPSAVAFAYCGYGAARFYFLPPIPPSDKTGVQLIDLFTSGVRVLGKLAEVFGRAIEWVLIALSVVSFGCLVFAVLLYFHRARSAREPRRRSSDGHPAHNPASAGLVRWRHGNAQARAAYRLQRHLRAVCLCDVGAGLALRRLTCPRRNRQGALWHLRSAVDTLPLSMYK